MAVGFAAALGGCGTIIAFPSQHNLINNLLLESGNEPMSFFFGMRVMLVGLAIMIVYFLTIGRTIQEKCFDFEEIQEDVRETSEKTKHKTWKMVLSSVIMVVTIILIVTGALSNGVAALLGSTAMVITGCVDIRTALDKVHWDIILMAGCLFAFAEGFNNSGASEICVNAILNFFGTQVSPWLLYAAVLICAVLLTSVIDNVATVALLGPIALSIASRFNMNATTFLFSVLAASNIAYATPISCPCISMTLSGGYRFKDYLRFGGPLSIISYIAVIVLVPIMYNL